MNLADIRKKAEENRKLAAAVSNVDAVASDFLPEQAVPAYLIIEEPVLNNFEMPVEELPEEPCVYDASSMAHFCPVPDLPVYPDEHIPASLHASVVVTAEEEKTCPPISSVSLQATRKPAGYNPIEIILSGRESVSDSDDTALFQSQSYAYEDVEEYLCFRVAHEEYAISIMAIKEIVKPRDVTEVPRMPPSITGIISLRGVIIPVMDMRIRLSLPVSAAAGRERIIVLRRDTGFCGVLVDEVIQVARIKRSDIEDPPTVLDGIDRDFVTGLGHFDNRMLILLNLGTILDISVH